MVARNYIGNWGSNSKIMEPFEHVRGDFRC